MVIQHDNNTTLALYIIIFDNLGNNVWDTVTGSWVDYTGLNPWDYAIDLVESAERTGWYSFDVDLLNAGDGWIRYKVYKRVTGAYLNTDYTQSIDSIYVVDGEEFEFEGLIIKLLEILTQAGGVARFDFATKQLLTRLATRINTQR